MIGVHQALMIAGRKNVTSMVWVPRVASVANSFTGVARSESIGLFVAISNTGSSNRVMTSPNGEDWTTGTTENYPWEDICYSDTLGKFCAISYATSGSGRYMVSSDGLSWADGAMPISGAHGICWADTLGLFVVVGAIGTNRVATSPDGVNWTAHVGNNSKGWRCVTYSENLALLIAGATDVSGGQNVMTSQDGSSWDIRSTPIGEIQSIHHIDDGVVTKIAAVGGQGVTYSADGTLWLDGHESADNVWRGVTSGAGNFVAVSSSGSSNRSMVSSTGGLWGSQVTPNDQYRAIAYSDSLGVFVAVATDGDRVMTGTLN